MNRKNCKYCFLILAYFFSIIQAKADFELTSKKILFSPNTDIPVGTKINDSTGTINISNSMIQTSLIAIIPLLNGISVTGIPNLSIGSGANYLLFKGTNVTGDTVEVAIELITVGLTNLIFKQHGGKSVHLSKKTGACGNTSFVMDRQKRIMGCKCNQIPSNSQSEWGCKHSMSIQY